jgi:hypothetical protein
MKYLKRFNEELKASTYKKAGEKFTQMGHKRRGSELLDYATQVELREKSDKLLQAQNVNKEFGLFDITVARGYGSNKKDIFSGQFYLQICLESDWFKDQFNDWLYEGMTWSMGIAMEFAIIPADDETLKMFETSEDSDIVYFRNNSMWGDDYRYWTNRLWINLVAKGGAPSYTCGSGGFEDRDGFTFHFNSRSEAMKFKNLLANTLEGNSNWGAYGERTIADQLKSTISLDEELWRKKLMDHYLDGREDECDLTDPDTWPKNPFGEDTYKGAVDAAKRMSVNGLYRD